MRTEALREVLLVRAIEESDASGRLLPFEERERAARDAMRSTPLATDELGQPAATSRVVEALSMRASRLLPPVLARHPALGDLLARSDWPRWAGVALLVVAFASGVSLSALHGSRRINILALPFLGLLAWNLVVYAWILIASVRAMARPGLVAALPGSAVVRGLGRRLGPLVTRIAQVDTEFGTAARRYATDYTRADASRIGQLLRQWLHLAAAILALGLLAGLYLRGIGHSYVAGWESTWLGPEQVRWLIDTIFGPPARWAAIALPTSVEAVAGLQFQPDGSGGESAAAWIHLMALCLLATIVLPRLVLAAAASWQAARCQRSDVLPESLANYAGQVLGAGGQGQSLEIDVVPYAHEPTTAARTALESTARDVFGRHARLRWLPAIAYGDEETGPMPTDGAAGRLVLMNLAATPESENHGRLLSLLRARSPAMHTVLVLDATSYAERFGADPASAGRLEERRRLWQAFARSHGLDAVFVAAGSSA